MKRFIFRKRPSAFQPPRSLGGSGLRGSSLPSRVVVTFTTMTYVYLSLKNWNGITDDTPLISQKWLLWCLTIGAWIVISFFRVNLGDVYPSDCLISIVPILVIIGGMNLTYYAKGGLPGCPTCEKS